MRFKRLGTGARQRHLRSRFGRLPCTTQRVDSNWTFLPVFFTRIGLPTGCGPSLWTTRLPFALSNSARRDSTPTPLIASLPPPQSSAATSWPLPTRQSSTGPTKPGLWQFSTPRIDEALNSPSLGRFGGLLPGGFEVGAVGVGVVLDRPVAVVAGVAKQYEVVLLGGTAVLPFDDVVGDAPFGFGPTADAALVSGGDGGSELGAGVALASGETVWPARRALTARGPRQPAPRT